MSDERFQVFVEVTMVPYFRGESLSKFAEFMEYAIPIRPVISLAAWTDTLIHIVGHLDPKSVAFEAKEPLKLHAKLFVHTFVKSKFTVGEPVPQTDEIVDHAFELIEGLKLPERDRCKNSIGPLKEEIMKAALHPSRVMRLVENHGMDVLDNM